MLGQFFNSRKGQGAPPPTPTLDSATEESHTRHLLYPDASTPYHPETQPYPLHAASQTPGGGHDGPQPEIDLEFPRDCRIIIAQDNATGQARAILFDSKPGQSRAESPTNLQPRSRVFSNASSASTAGPTFGGMHARRSSLVTESTTPRSPTIPSFTRVRTRGNSISSMPNIDEHAQTQAQSQAKTADSFDVVKRCLDCMFGNVTMTYRGNSNKLHIVPLDSRPSDPAPSTPGHQDASQSMGSLGRAEGMRRRSHLAKSFTAANLPAEQPRPDLTLSTGKDARRRTIFMTRMFSVTLPDDSPNSSKTHTPHGSVGKESGFPFPSTTNKAGAPRPMQARKTPMYAITIILQLPVAPPSASLRPTSRSGNANKGLGQMSTSAPGQGSLGSSLESERRGVWSSMDPNIAVESLVSATLNSDVDDRVDVIGQHWDVISRTLTSLQHVVQERILAQFKMEETINMPRNQPGRYANKETTQRTQKLKPNALALDPKTQEAVELAGMRIVGGMRIPRVITGQGKWGVWREEARWLGRWAGRREENFFFSNLLTAFLGNHTEWLNLLGPKWHRKRHREQQRSNHGDNQTIANRTVIVSPDKMAARRLIFLLAAFLPSNVSSNNDTMTSMRPSTSASLRGYSQSPPTNMPPSRKHSLRRQINRRPKGKQSVNSVNFQPTGDALGTIEITNGPPEPAVRRPPSHSRRSSAHSIQTSLVLPSMSDNVATKGTIATVSTVTPQNAFPVAHFALPRSSPLVSAAEERPASSDSLASANLINTLQRSGTGHISNASTDSGNTSRWSVFSMFSGGRRQSSTEHSDLLQTTDDGLGVSNGGYRGNHRSPLEMMVQELSMNSELFGESDETPLANDDVDDGPEVYSSSVGGSGGVPASAARPIPERQKQSNDTPWKLSVNEKDGVIDVDIALPDFGSPLQSPFMGGSASSQQGSSYGESSMFSMPQVESEQAVNVAGWLKQFHSDFAVQAIRPYADLDRDIKRAMSAEPTPITSAVTPSLEQGPLERWVDVCSALIADTRTFSIKRLRLRRLVKLIPTPVPQPTALTPGISGVPRSQYGNPYNPSTLVPAMSEIYLKEEFIEEQIMDFDAILIDAIDRVLAQSGQASRVQSNSSSRSSSRRGRRDTRSGSDVGNIHTHAHANSEVAPPDCKGIIFDALESVVKNVTAERGSMKDLSKTGLGEKTTTAASSRAGSVKTATDSSLKEGVRRWLSEVE